MSTTTDYEVMSAHQGVPIFCWTKGVPVEDEARRQLVKVASLPFIFRHVAAMPDVHLGMGATIGSVIPTVDAVIPAAVGVDIGCGMCAVRTTLSRRDLPANLAPLRQAIEAAVPHGRTHNGGKGDRGAWGTVPAAIQAAWDEHLADDFERIASKLVRVRGCNSLHHLGTLGTGNHFIEIEVDAHGRIWLMLHSGSRGVGNSLAQVFIRRAKDLMARWFISLPDPDLAYLPVGSPEFTDYIEAATWAQRFAQLNRELMLAAVVTALRNHKGLPDFDLESEAVNCHHNYVARERHYGRDVWVTRKGAVRAGDGEPGIIPGSMGSRSYIVRGKGRRESFCSCSHGAGRAMSRSAAKKRFTVEDHVTATVGVECRKDRGVLDETPRAYKDIDAVMAAQQDLVTIEHTLKQVVCVKG